MTQQEARKIIRKLANDYLSTLISEREYAPKMMKMAKMGFRDEVMEVLTTFEDEQDEQTK